MRAFACSHCGQLLFFENSHCLRCGTSLGFAPDVLKLRTLDPIGRELYRALDAPRRSRYRRCARAELSACNWLIPDDEPEELCVSCRLTSSLPPLHGEVEARALAQAETAKRRLLYQLLDLELPFVGRGEDPEQGLAFVLGFRSEELPMMTGHLDGVITLDLSECDTVHRERLRHAFGEPYRTLLGHFRHEIGHYYWNVLIAGRPAHEGFRALFGDERIDYAEALKRNYESTSSLGWCDRHVSAYAASHPWEDWAETFAHYLHIHDTLQTAASFGLHVSPRAQTIPPEGGKLSARPRDAFLELDFDAIVGEWLPLTYAFNAASRSMGKEDLYPFVLAPTVIEKLAFVHDVARGVVLSASADGSGEITLPRDEDTLDTASAA